MLGVFEWVTGQSSGSSYLLTRWVFLRLLGVVYLIAFVSLWVQVHGLVGERGILPAGEFLGWARRRASWERLRLFPTVFWLGTSDRALSWVCAIGTVSALALVLGVAPMPALVVLWVAYLSLSVVGQEFLSFQWDALLLETGFLAIFLAPPGLLEGPAPVAPVVLFLLWWLLFRLLFESGVVKLSHGDRTWWDLTALDYHFYTQPLPTFIGWYFHHLPSRFRRLSVVLVYLLEIVFPLFIFGPRGWRLLAFAGTVSLQLLILVTGNYNFFNLLTLSLALLLLDDAVWRQVLPPELVAAIGGTSGPPGHALWVHLALAGVVLLVSVPQLARAISPSLRLPGWTRRLERLLGPWRSLNSYGLFRVMTTSRPEIVVEGSRDGRAWTEYEFRHKPGNPDRPPGFVEPHQPRLDWQMWFAALGSYHASPWFESFLARLLEGSPAVLGLLAGDPFAGERPLYVRAVLYDYTFTTPAERRQSGHWWRRERLGLWSPTLSLGSDSVPVPD